MNLFDIENQCRMCEISGQAVRDVLVKTPCGHNFHRFCLEDYCEGHPFCPVCETHLPDMSAVKFLRDSKNKISTLEKKVVEITAVLEQESAEARDKDQKIRSLEHQLATAKAKLGDKPSPTYSLSKSGGSVHPPGVDTRFWID